MNILIVYYSRTGATKKVALKLQDAFDFCDVEEIVCPEIKAGFWGALKAGYHTFKKLKTQIKPIKFDPNRYDLVMIGTPVWIGTMASPTRSYISRYKDQFKKVASFCTCGSRQDKTFGKIKELSGKEPVATLEILAKKVESEESEDRIRSFVQKIRSQRTQT